MGLLTFIKEAGQKLFKMGHADAAATQAETSTAPSQDMSTLNATAANAILGYIGTQNLTAQNLSVEFDGASATVTVKGEAQDQATREKIVLCCGNVANVEHVNDQLTVAASTADEARYYTVKSGDTLSKIAKEMYDDANQYPVIFEANKPMLTHPDKIYPGQMLRIPPQE